MIMSKTTKNLFANLLLIIGAFCRAHTITDVLEHIPITGYWALVSNADDSIPPKPTK